MTIYEYFIAYSTRLQAPPRTLSGRRSCRIRVGHAYCSLSGRASRLRPGDDPAPRSARPAQPRGSPGRPVGSARAGPPRAGPRLPRPQGSAVASRDPVLGRRPAARPGAGRVVGDPAATLPGGGARRLGTRRPARPGRPAHRQRQDPRGGGRDGADAARQPLPRAHPGAPRPVEARAAAGLPRGDRLLRRRRARARAGDRRDVRERLPAHGPARQPVRPARRRRGASLRLRDP